MAKDKGKKEKGKKEVKKGKKEKKSSNRLSIKVIAYKVAESYDNVPRKNMYELVKDVFAEMAKAFVAKKTVNVSGFGTFKVVHRKAREGFNPKTRKKIQIEAKDTVKFRPVKDLKAAMNA